MASAAEVFVDSVNGNDSRTYVQAQNASTPWATLCRATNGAANDCAEASTNAAAAAQSGDTITVAANDTQSGVGRDHAMKVTFSPANSNITIRCATRGTCRLTRTTGYGPAIGSQGVDGVTWDGFLLYEIENPTAGDTGIATFNQSDNSALRYTTIIGWTGYTETEANHCLFYNSMTMLYELSCGNHVLVRIEEVGNITIDHNTLTTVRVCTSGTLANCGHVYANGAGIQGYDVDGALIEYNTIGDVGAGIFAKGNHGSDGVQQQNWIVRYNYIYDIGDSTYEEPTTGIYMQVIDGAQIYQNIIVRRATVHANDPTYCFTLYGFPGNGVDTPDGPTDVDFVNNTCDNFHKQVVYEQNGGTLTFSTVRVFNNIFINGKNCVGSDNQSSIGGSAHTSHEHNVCFGFSSNFLNFGGTTGTLASWQSVTWGTQDAAAPATVSTDPQMTSATDYHPLAGFVATQGRDILDLDGDTLTNDAIPAGAYITGSETIGTGVIASSNGAGGGARISVRVR